MIQQFNGGQRVDSMQICKAKVEIAHSKRTHEREWAHKQTIEFPGGGHSGTHIGMHFS
jgi:hypothetical protein